MEQLCQVLAACPGSLVTSRSAGSVSVSGRNLFLDREDVDVLEEYEGMPPEAMDELVGEVNRA